MFNITLFYHTDVLELHYLFFFSLENNFKKNRKTYFVSQGLNEIKCKITLKTKRKLKVNPYLIDATFMMSTFMNFVYLSHLDSLAFFLQWTIGSNLLELRIKKNPIEQLSQYWENFKLYEKDDVLAHSVHPNQTVW